MAVYPMEFYDYVPYTFVPGFTTISLPIGEDATPNDLRVFWIMIGNDTVGTAPTIGAIPSGFTKIYDQTFTASGNYFRLALILGNIPQNPVDLSCTIGGSYAEGLWLQSVSVHNYYPKQTSWNAAGIAGFTYSTGTVTVNSPNFTVVPGSLLLFTFEDGSDGNMSPAPPSSLARIGADPANKVSLYGQAFTTPGTSGIYGFPIAANTVAQLAFTGLCLAQNPDQNFTMSTATTEADTASAFSASILNTSTFVMGTAREADQAAQFFTPLKGFRVSLPVALPLSPITNSVIHWEQDTSGGGTVLVETSVDGGLTWQLATSDEPVPRLLSGSSVYTSVITRVTLSRTSEFLPTPRVSDLEVYVATDSSYNELVPLGMFTITDTEISVVGGTTGGSSGSSGGGDGVTGTGGGNSGGGLSIEISGVDLSRMISRNQWQDVFFIPEGTNYATAIYEIINDRLPGLSYNFVSSEVTTPKIVLGTEPDNDPWQDAQDLATAIGYEVFFDAAGVVTLRPVPDPASGQSVWTFSDSANPTIAALVRSLTDQTTFNIVTAYGESVDNAVPVSATVYDDDPNSPTYYLGPYGQVPVTFTSAMITTEAQAYAAAQALLLACKGAAENVELSTVAMPALEPGDVVTVQVGDAKIVGTFLINDLEISLSAAEAETFTVYRQSSS